MNRTEVKDILIDRMVFRDGFAVPQSGMYYDDEHYIVNLCNIEETKPMDLNIVDFEQSVIFQVINDVFDTDVISDSCITCNSSLFDNLILKMMAIKTINLILTSTRSNKTERITKEVLQSIRFELVGNSSAESGFPVALGIYGKYRQELKRVRNYLNKPKTFKSITTG